jgi:hypothetical protein
MSNVAGTYLALGRHADALALFQMALKFKRRVLPADHPDIGEGPRGEGCVACGVIIVKDCFWFDFDVQARP